MQPAHRTRILIVDDSAVMRSLLRSVVTADTSLEVAGTAADGASAISNLTLNHPDLILLDVEMPVMDGLATLKELRRRGHKMPVIMCSSLTQRGAKVTIEALAGGAADYVTKPAGQTGREAALHTISQDLLPKIHALTDASRAQAFTQPLNPLAFRSPSPLRGTSRPSLIPSLAKPSTISLRPQPITSTPTIVAIGVSTGGPAALDVLLPALPAAFPLPVVIVQHMPELFTRLFAERLNGHCKLRVREASEGEAVHAGNIYIARGNWHLEVMSPSPASAPPTLHLSQGSPENHCRPAVDVLFRSIARVYGAGVLAVMLTGMGSDGLLGSRVIREQGGCILAQDEASSTVWGMPGAVATAGLAQRILPLDAIAPEILRVTGRSRADACPPLRVFSRQGVS